MKALEALVQIGVILIFTLFSGCKKSESENVLSVTTGNVELWGEGIYTLKGTVVTMGREEIIEHGFYWSQSQNPEKDGDTVLLGARSSTGTFSVNIHDIQPGKTYYVRAFATTGSNSCNGDVKSFSTPENMRQPVFDIENNIYYPVKIGDQTWLGSNLQVKHYPDGSSIPLVEDQQAWFNFSLYTRAYCWYENYSAIGSVYGALYTWPAAMNISSPADIKPGHIQGVCPDGWHLPGDNEWKQLELYLGMDTAEVELENWRGNGEGGKLKQEGTSSWFNPNTGSTDETGFSALPSGWRDGGGYFKDLGTTARFWSSSTRGDYAWARRLDNNSPQIYRSADGLYNGYSVRCIRD